MNTHGTHLLADLHGCNAEVLDDAARIEAAMLVAARAAGCVVIGSRFHRFQPQGVTGLLLIAESHLSVHTWPESGYAAVDLYTCGDTHAEDAIEGLAQALQAQRVDTVRVVRGQSTLPSVRASEAHTAHPAGSTIEKMAPSPGLPLADSSPSH